MVFNLAWEVVRVEVQILLIFKKKKIDRPDLIQLSLTWSYDLVDFDLVLRMRLIYNIQRKWPVWRVLCPSRLVH